MAPHHLLAHVNPAINASEEGPSVDSVVKKNAELTVDELKAKSSIIGDPVNSGDVQIVTGYNLDSGEVDFN